jgi:hypothetical protein
MMICETRFGGPSVIGYDPFGDLPRTSYPPVDITALTLPCEGSCLDPIVMDGDVCFLDMRPPKACELAAFYLDGDPTQRLKIYLGSYDRGETIYPQFGDKQPEDIVVVLCLQPLAIHVMAQVDILRLHAVTDVWGPDGHRDVRGGVTIAPEHWEAVQRAMRACLLTGSI